ncbi:hypothetical protein L1049_004939 [Liquidambar formosana]|uniref:Uncharacterized protein n=1 Tax=Liquidambar formosana TaxID=63359 RepID=A0AAP0RQH7_LIQFO
MDATHSHRKDNLCLYRLVTHSPSFGLEVTIISLLQNSAALIPFHEKVDDRRSKTEVQLFTCKVSRAINA